MRVGIRARVGVRVRVRARPRVRVEVRVRVRAWLLSTEAAECSLRAACDVTSAEGTWLT